jgi:uncharacterized lipoprotein
MSLDRTLPIIAAAMLLCACHTFSRVVPDCRKPQEYQRAAQLAPLKVPAGLDTPNTQGALAIPTVELSAPPPGPNTACLDTPPRYKPAPTSKAGSG